MDAGLFINASYKFGEFGACNLTIAEVILPSTFWAKLSVIELSASIKLAALAYVCTVFRVNLAL